ncbi:hypothetical protein J1N35_037684 [Gossypium stocksii]|uniref:Uncharacterized protein n=1 Tax=Gossypium stocksii TaxID=47602 RepID=A0A9D3UK99_9ROSI|nr:hypothetical protein J1N35_037684 [Gossypium stocksii]
MDWRVSIQESKVNTVSPATGNDNTKVGTEALARIVREVLEKVFEASLERNRELVQSRCVDYRKKRDRSPSRLEPRSAKCVKLQLSVSKCSVEGSSSGVDVLVCEHCKKCHLGDYWKKSKACLRNIALGRVLDDIELGLVVGYCNFVCY